MSDKEIWKDIEGYEGYYQVSNLGRVRSLTREVRCGNSIRVFRERIRKPQIMSKGYYQLALLKNGKDKRFLIHRLVAYAFIPNPENKTEVNHINGVKTDNNVENLEWVTSRENSIHAVHTGLHNAIKGERHANSKLNRKDVLEIRRRYIKGCAGQKKLAKEYCVTRNTIYKIVKGITWKHI